MLLWCANEETVLTEEKYFCKIKELFFVSQKYNFVPQQMLRVLRRGNFSDNAFAKTGLRKAFVKNLSDYMFIVGMY